MKMRTQSVLIPSHTNKLKKEEEGWILEAAGLSQQIREDAHILAANEEDDYSDIYSDSSRPDSLQKFTSKRTLRQFEEEKTLDPKFLTFEFDVYEFAEKVKRGNALVFLTLEMMKCLPTNKGKRRFESFDEGKLINFSNEISHNYHPHVAYHNDLHAADVAQMCYLFITEGNLADMVDLTYLEASSMIVACMCHDVDHDGFTNAYHVSAESERALRYHDKAVQENWHAALAISTMKREENDFMLSLSNDEKTLFRKRIVSMILATDMAQHNAHVEEFNA